MKYSVTHPVIVDVKSARTKGPHKTAMTMKSTIDIPMLNFGEDVVKAVEYDIYTSQKQKKRTVVVQDLAGNYYIPASCPGFDEITPVNATTVSQAVGQHLATRALRVIESLETKVRFPNGPSAGKKDAHDLFVQPDISALSSDQIDLEALRNEADMITEAARDFVFVGRTLFSRVPEPFYAVTAGPHYSTTLHVLFGGDLPDMTIAVFRLGRANDALLFAENVAKAEAGHYGPFKGPRNLQEGDGCNSEMNDMGITAAIASSRAYSSFRRDFNHEYMGKATVDRLILDTPVEQIALARRLHAATRDRSYFHLAEDAETLWPLIEEAVELGASTPFTRGGVPLDLVLDLWHNETITLDVERKIAP